MATLMDVPVPFCLLVYLSFLSTAVCSLPEGVLEGLPYNLQMESHNFQHILSWQTKHDPAVPKSFTVLYRDHRHWQWVAAAQCSGTARPWCDLSQEFTDPSTEYQALVQSAVGAQVLNSSVLRFVPLTQTILGPPEVNVTSCLNCINVTIKLPTSHFRAKEKLLSLIDIYDELDYDITLKSRDGEHKRPREKTTEEVFSTVIEDLYPSRNYCVSVVVTASLNKHSVPSSWKCVTADSEARQGSQVVAAAVGGAVCFSLLIAALLKCVHAAGFVLWKKSLPWTLEFIRMLAYSPWVFESEKVDSVEIIPREAKPKARGCRGSARSASASSASGDSDSSDSDSSAPCDYTRREGLSRGRAPPGCGTPSPAVQYSGNSSCGHSGPQAGDIPAAEPQGLEEHELGLEGDRDTGSELLSPFSEGSCNSQRSSECFTINLHSVLLGTLQEDVDSSAPAASSQEGAGGWQCARALEGKLLEDVGSVGKASSCNDFHEWQNSSPPSEESDSSDSDTEHVTEYMRR